MEPTLQTIADAVGVSRMTVSRALRADPSIPPRTRARIVEAARRLGYRPDPLVSALMTRLRASRPRRERPVLACLDTLPERSTWRRFRFVRQALEGMERRADALGYAFERFALARLGVEEGQVARILVSRGIRGVLIPPLEENRPLQVDLGPFASAALGPSVTEPRVHRAQSDTARNLRTALGELDRLGRPRAGLVLEQAQDDRTERILSALMLREGRGVPTLLVPALGREALARWVARHRPESILTFSHEAAWWLREAGGPRPFVVNLNHQPDDGADAGIDQRMGQVGAAVVDLVAEQLQSNQVGLPATPKTVLLPGSWVAG